jgi:hypothetical protein
MRKTAVIISVVALAFATFAPMAGAAPIDFRGDWSGVDTSDGSNLTMSVRVLRPNPTAIVHIADDSSALCGGAAATGAGSGDPTGKHMTVVFTLRCDGSDTPVGSATITFFAQTDGTLTDTAHPGTIWSH